MSDEPRLVDLIHRRHVNVIRQRRWELRAQGFVAAFVVIGVAWVLLYGVVTR